MRKQKTVYAPRESFELLSPEEQRAVVLLVGLEQFRYDEVATVLDLPIGTVMSRLHRGRERLRRALAGEVAPVLRRVK